MGLPKLFALCRLKTNRYFLLNGQNNSQVMNQTVVQLNRGRHPHSAIWLWANTTQPKSESCFDNAAKKGQKGKIQPTQLSDL